MCGRYALAQEHEALKIRFGFSDDPTSSFHQSPRYNIAPTQLAAVITNGSGAKLRGMRWGLIPHWAKDTKVGNSLINARSETASEKPSFRDSFKNKRCLIPATGFFEWREIGAKKQPMYISLTDQDIFAFAGLWSVWKEPPSGNEVFTYTILTTEPNEFLAEVHNRMPVILPRETEDSWLDASKNKEQLQALLKPYPSEMMTIRPVSTTVNSPRNDSPICIEPMPSLM